MPEFRKMIPVNSKRLSRRDLEKLMDIVTDNSVFDDTNYSGISFSVDIESGDVTYSDKSLHELLSQNIPDRIDSFQATFYDHSKKRRVSVQLGRTNAYATVSSEDEVWYRGKLEQIREYFRRRRPWFSINRNALQFFGGIINGLLMGGSLIMFVESRHAYGVLLIISALAVTYSSIQFMNGNFFPVTRVQLNEFDKKVNWGALSFAAGATGTFITLVGLLWEILMNVGR